MVASLEERLRDIYINLLLLYYCYYIVSLLSEHRSGLQIFFEGVVIFNFYRNRLLLLISLER